LPSSLPLFFSPIFFASIPLLPLLPLYLYHITPLFITPLPVYTSLSLPHHPPFYHTPHFTIFSFFMPFTLRCSFFYVFHFFFVFLPPPLYPLF
jgi:hypothetical protein